MLSCLQHIISFNAQFCKLVEGGERGNLQESAGKWRGDRNLVGTARGKILRCHVLCNSYIYICVSFWGACKDCCANGRMYGHALARPSTPCGSELALARDGDGTSHLCRSISFYWNRLMLIHREMD